MNVKVFSSILDYPHPGLDPYVWAQDGTLLPENKDEILGKLNDYLVQAGLRSPEKWITSLHIVGSLTTYQYARDTDVDLHIGVNFPAFQKYEKPNLSAEEAEKFLDDLRKEASKEHRFLPNTQHPIEFYFLTPSAKEDTTHVGVYDLYTDKWIKAPVAISADFDIEESQPKFIEDAMELAGEIDESLGKIKQHIRRVEDLQDVIKEWSPDKRKSFEQKLQNKLEAIEDEIDTLVKTKKQIQEQRKDVGFDPESEREVKFKYLQKFGYFFIISRLRDLFDAEKEDVQVTEQDVPKIKEIVECPVDVKGSIDISAHDVPKSDPGSGKLMIDFDNTIAVNSNDHEIGELEPGVKEALSKLKADGWIIIIYSARANRPEGIDEIKDFMSKNELPYDEIFVGKPDAELYIDDRNIVFTNWSDVLKSVDEHGEHSEKDASLHIAEQENNQEVKHDFSTTQFNMPKDVSQKIIEWCVNNIPNEDLYDDGSGRFARALECHMTVLYGLLANESKEVEELLADEKPVTAKFGKTIVFETPEKDAIVIEADCQGAVDLHDKLKELENEDQQPEYKPHVTVAYVKSGKGKKYKDKDILGEDEIVLDTVKFNPKEGDPVFITLGKQKKEAADESISIPHGGVILKNPTADDAEDLLNASSYKTLRWGAIGHNLYIWDADAFIHSAASRFLGKNFGYQNFDTGILETVEAARDWANRFEKDRYDDRQSRMSSDHVLDSFIEKKAKLHWVDPQTPENVLQNSDVNKATFKDFLSKGWVAIDEQASPKRVLVDDLEFTPDWLDTYLGNMVGWGEDVELTDKHGNTVPLHFPTKNIKRQIRRKLYPPEDVTAAFMPSIVQAPDNHWQTDSDVELPLDPDTVSEEETSNKNFLVDKPKKTLWNRILDMFKSDDTKEASIDKKSSEARGWLDPKGEFFSFGDFDYEELEGTTHADWLMDDLDFLKDNYNIDPQELRDSGDPVATLVDKGWVRISDDYHRLGVQVQTLAHIPDFVTDHLLKTTPIDTEVTFEDLDGVWVETSDWAKGAQKAVNRALQRKRMIERQQPVEGSIKEAYLDHAYWIAPDNKVYVVRGGGQGNDSKYTHGQWAKRNRVKLKQKYDLDIIPEYDAYEATQYMIDAGWIRIGDAQSGRGWAVMKHNIREIPTSVDNLLATFLHDGDEIAVEDLESGDYVEVTYPFKSLQNEVQRYYRAQNQNRQPQQDVPIPQPESEPGVDKTVDVQGPVEASQKTAVSNNQITDILKLIQETGGATYNLSQGSLAGTANYAVSIYPDRSVILDHTPTAEELGSYIQSNSDLLSQSENSVGVWSSGGKTYLDVSLTIPDKNQAIELGKKHNQIAIFDLKTFEEIPIGGTGEVQSKHAAIGDVRVWIDPTGKVHELDMSETHQGWAERYGIQHGMGELSSYNLIDDGWVRIGDTYEDSSAFNIELKDMTHIPDFVDSFADSNYHGGVIEVEDNTGTVQIDDPFPSLQKAVNRARLRKRTSKKELGLSKYARFEGTAWVDPEGKIFRVKRTHAHWVYENLEMLENKYGYSIAEGTPETDPELLVRELLEYEWTRIADWTRGAGYVQVSDLSAVPSGLQFFLDENYDWGNGGMIVIDDSSGAYAEVQLTGNVQEDINEARRRAPNRTVGKSLSREIEKQAFSKHAVWIDPNGKVYEVRGAEMGRDTTHAQWVVKNRQMLRTKYKIKLPQYMDTENAFDVNSYLIEAGWTRIGDYMGGQIGIRTNDLSSIPGFVDDTLASFAREGETVHIENVDGSEFATFTYPVKSIQSEVNRALRDQMIERRRQQDLDQQELNRRREERKQKEEKELQDYQDSIERERERLKDVPLPEQVREKQPEQLELPLSGKKAYEGPSTTWKNTEPFQPLPTTFTTDTNDENLNSRYPWKFMKKPTGPEYSNEGEVDEMLVEDEEEKEMPLSTRAMQKKALTMSGYWVAPDGNVFEVRSGGKWDTHGNWVFDNLKMLKKKYGIESADKNADYFTTAREMLEKGWARIGDTAVKRGVVGIEVASIRNIPSYIDNAVASFATDGELIIVADLNENWAEITWPVNSIQKAVARNRGRRASLTKTASTHGWLAPDGTLYEFYDQNHAGWVRNNQKMLKKKYGITIKEGDFYDLVNSLVAHNWVRITGDLNDGYYVKDIRNIPDALVEFFETHTPDVFLDIMVEDMNHNHVNMVVEEVLEKGLREAINDDLKRPSIPEWPKVEAAKKPTPASPSQVDGHISPDGQFYTNEGLTHNQWAAKYFRKTSGRLLNDGWMRIAGGGGGGFAAEYSKQPTDSQWQKVEDILFGGPGDYVTIDYWENADSVASPFTIFRPVKKEDLDQAGVSLKEFASNLKPWKTLGGSLKKRAFSDKDVKDEAYGLWQDAIHDWESKINPIEQAIIQNGGIAAYRPSADTGKVEEREEYRGIPVRLRGTTSYDEMIDLLKSQNLLDQDAGYGDLYDIISHLPERGHRPRWQDFIEEAKHNLEYQGALKLHAFNFQGHAYWVDPNGKAFEVRDSSGGPTTHWDWISRNEQMLEDEYGIKASPSARAPTDYIYALMVDSGWVRIGDAGSYGKRWGIEVDDIHHLPTFLDGFLASFLTDGNEVDVEDRDGQLARVIYPFKSLQTAVNQDLANEIGTKAQKEAGNESNTYTDDEMEKIYTEQHADEMKQDDGGGYTPRDFGDSSTDFPKPEDTERKQKIQLDLLEPTQTPPIASYEVTWYFGSPADDNGSM